MCRETQEVGLCCVGLHSIAACFMIVLANIETQQHLQERPLFWPLCFRTQYSHAARREDLWKLFFQR